MTQDERAPERDPLVTVSLAAMDHEHVGRVVGALVGLKAVARDLFVILPEGTRRADADSVAIDEHGIRVEGELVAPFLRMRTPDRGDGGSCVAFGLEDGREGMIAPAERPEGMDAEAEIMRFVDATRDDDDVFLLDLSRPVAPVPGHERDVVETVRPDGDDGSAGSACLRVLGHVFRFDDVVWADSAEDGSGANYLHLVTRDGSYRMVASGDLSR
jgi:hypothetical protein